MLQVWAHIECLQTQMEQHPRHFHYDFEQYMCDLCQHELRQQAAQMSRSAQTSPRAGPTAHRKFSPACARTTEVSSVLAVCRS